MAWGDTLEVVKKINKNIGSDTQELVQEPQYNFVQEKVEKFDVGKELDSLKDEVSFKEKLKRSKLPDIIKESFEENTGLDLLQKAHENRNNETVTKVEEKMNGGFNRSREIMYKMNNYNNLSKNKNNSENEEYNNSAINKEVNNSNIDYNYIRFIIQDELSKIFNNKKENNLKGIQINEDGNFIFVDESGNVFEADFKYIGNNND